MNKPLLLLLVTLLSTILANESYAAATNQAQSKDWVWSLSPDADGMYYAGTENSVGNVLGLFCYSNEPGDNCFYATQLGSTCVHKHTHTAILNSEDGAAPVTLTCGTNNNFSIAPFDTVSSAVRGKSVLSIAIPLDDGSFTVSRFSLKGSTAAITGMNTAARQAAYIRL